MIQNHDGGKHLPVIFHSMSPENNDRAVNLTISDHRRRITTTK